MFPDSEWFLKQLEGDGVITRMNLRGPVSRVAAVGKFYAYYHDCEGYYIGAEIVYRNDPARGGVQPLEFNPFPEDRKQWERHVEGIMEAWLPAWQQPKTVICTQQPGDLELFQNAWLPSVIHHLAIVEGMSYVNPYQRVLLMILGRRLNGLVRAKTNDMLQNPTVIKLVSDAAKMQRNPKEDEQQ